MRGDYPSSSLIKSYTNMLANADDGSLSTKDKSLPLTRLAIALSLKISVNKTQLFRRSQNTVTCIVTCDCYQSKVVVSVSTFYEVCWCIKSKAITFTNIKFNEEPSLHGSSFRLLVSVFTRLWETFPSGFMRLQLRLK